MNRLLNALGFQAGWWACVMGAAQGQQGLAIVLALVLVAGHLYFVAQRSAEIRLALVSLLMGGAVDSALQSLSVISFAGASLSPLSPPWLWMLWVLFALTLHSSLAFLKGLHWSLLAGLGAVFGPLSYIVGARMGAATFDGSLVSTAALALAWALALPLLVLIAARQSMSMGR